MSWNRPNEKTVENKGRGSQRKVHLKGLVAGLSVIVLGTVAVLFFVSPAEKRERPAEQQASTLIREVNPAVVRANAASSAKKARPAERPPQRPGEVRDGYIMFADGSKARCQGVVTSGVDNTCLISKTFARFSDQLIAHLVTLEPGTGMLGSSEELYRNFDAEFEESLKEEIVITPDDNEEQQELKREIVELRKELKARKAEGENLAELMADTRNKFMELAAYRDDLEREVEAVLADKEFSEKDEDELIRAANLMLEDRGIKPFELPSAAKYYIEKQFNPNR